MCHLKCQAWGAEWETRFVLIQTAEQSLRQKGTQNWSLQILGINTTVVHKNAHIFGEIILMHFLVVACLAEKKVYFLTTF